MRQNFVYFPCYLFQLLMGWIEAASIFHFRALNKPVNCAIALQERHFLFPLQNSHGSPFWDWPAGCRITNQEAISTQSKPKPSSLDLLYEEMK